MRSEAPKGAREIDPPPQLAGLLKGHVRQRGEICHLLSNLGLLGSKLGGFDLPFAKVTGHVRLAQPGDDVVVNGGKTKQHIEAAYHCRNLSFDAAALCQIE
jgi:hypothetical protein